jgi:ammonia channel protein AmtB
MLWVGWFGFNGSNLESSGGATLRAHQYPEAATAAAVLSWSPVKP